MIWPGFALRVRIRVRVRVRIRVSVRVRVRVSVRVRVRVRIVFALFRFHFVVALSTLLLRCLQNDFVFSSKTIVSSLVLAIVVSCD